MARSSLFGGAELTEFSDSCQERLGRALVPHVRSGQLRFPNDARSAEHLPAILRTSIELFLY